MARKNRLVMSSQNFSNRHLDVTGHHCPRPVLHCKAALLKMHRGEILHLVASDPDSLREIPLLVTARGDELLEVHTYQGQLHFHIRSHSDPLCLRPRRLLTDLIGLLRNLALTRSTSPAAA